jgi:hypothetical protein
MDDLEDSLKRLFQDSRLDMRAAPDAEETVVRGARRVRRRRITMISTAGVMSLAVLAGGTFLLASPAPQPIEVATQPPTDLPITTTSPTTTSPTAASPPQESQPSPATSSTTATPGTPPTSRPVDPPIATPALGPTGFGSFRLGMTEDQVTATGEAQGVVGNETDSCASYQIEGMLYATLTVSKRYGLVAIALTAAASTSERIAIGSTEDQVRTTYRSTVSTTVPDNPNADYRFRYTAGKVSEITLAAKQSDCVA